MGLDKGFHPLNDGIDHINVYSKGATEVGRLLSNFALTPFEHKIYGKFNSIEGFWYWLATGKQYNNLRELYGYKAKSVGRIYLNGLNKEDYIVKDFNEIIEDVIKLKLKQNIKILQMLVETSDLPIVHYYYKKEINGDYNITHLNKHQWQMDILMKLRKDTQEWMNKLGISNLNNYKFKR